MEYVQSGIQLGVFIGKLFTRGLLDTKSVGECLDTLVANFVSVEHADAIRLIVEYMGPSYWAGHEDISRFMYRVAGVAGPLRGTMSVVGCGWTDEQVRGVFGRIVECCRMSVEHMTDNHMTSNHMTGDHA